MQVATPFAVERLGIIMEADPNDPKEAWGVLNPACARGRDGELYLFPRVVAEGNYSRIGRARVLFNATGDPYGVERLGYALEPTDLYERNPKSGGGCEDPRITYVPTLDYYVMLYTAYGLDGAKVALAISKDLVQWDRLGLLHFDPVGGVDFNRYGNKDAALFPEPLIAPDGSPALAILHRPSYRISRADGTVNIVLPRGIEEKRESIWISYCPLKSVQSNIANLTDVEQSGLLITPQQPWERLKVGAGAPPIATSLGWLLVYHGVGGRLVEGAHVQTTLRYSAGVIVLDHDNPGQVLYRSADPLLSPQHQAEREGIIPNVIFPTGVDIRDNNRIDIYYGMADSRIGAARLDLPNELPE